MTKLPRTAAPIPVALRTKHARTCERSCRGRGNMTTWPSFPPFRNRSHNTMLPVVITLTKPDLNALYFATYQLPRLPGWNQTFTVGHYWRAALVVFFHYGVDTGTVFSRLAFTNQSSGDMYHGVHRRGPPNGQGKESRYGWLYYRRIKTHKQFHRPMNRVVHAHMKSIRPESPRPDEPVFAGGTSRPNKQFQLLCVTSGSQANRNMENSGHVEGSGFDLWRELCAPRITNKPPSGTVIS